MFNNLGWFADQNIVNKPVVPLSSNPVPYASTSNLEPRTSSRTARAPLARRSTLPNSSERPSETQRQRTGTWSDSPHDDVVASLKGQLSHLKGTDATDKPGDRAGQVDSSAPEEAIKTRVLENMYDPFSGQSIGLLSPGDFDETHDDLWTHLAKIHELQSQISVMHMHMENLGTGERLARGERSADDEAENPEDTAKVAKDAEFAKLADQFTGRKEQIDKLMLKVCCLNLLRVEVLKYSRLSWENYHKRSMTFMQLVLPRSISGMAWRKHLKMCLQQHPRPLRLIATCKMHRPILM